MIIRIQDDLVKYTSFRDTVEIDCKNVGDGIALLMDRYPQLYVFLLNNDGAEAKAVSVKLNGEFVWHPDTCEKACSAETELVFGREIPVGEGKTGSMIVGAAMIIVGAVAMVYGNPFGPGLILAGASMFLSAAFAPKLAVPVIEDSLSGSPAYSFGGVKNTTAPGTPINVVYGEHRVGGHQLNIFTKFVAPNQPAYYTYLDGEGVSRSVQYTTLNNTAGEYTEYLYGQIGVSEGEIESISGIEVNGLPAAYFGELDTPEVRAGTRDQEVMADFSQIENTTSSGRLIIPNAYTPGTEVVTSGIETPVYGYVSEPTNKVITSQAWSPALDAQFSADGILPSAGSVTDTVNNIAYHSNAEIRYGSYKWAAGAAPGHWEAYSLYPNPQSGYKFIPGDVPIKCSDDDPARIRLPYSFLTYACLVKSNLHNVVRSSDGLTVSVPDTTKLIKTLQLNLTDGAAVHTLVSQCEGFRVTINAPSLFKLDGSNQYTEASVDITIAYREVDDTQPNRPWIVAVYKDTIKSKSASEVGRTYSVGEKSQFGWENKLPLAYYEVAVIRETPVSTDTFKVRDVFYLKEVTELTFQTLAYPHTALLGIKIKATDQLSGQVPAITSLVKGIKVAVASDQAAYNGATGKWYYSRDYSGAAWDGKLSNDSSRIQNTRVKVWTDNPVWCLYDLITNTRYGLGNFYRIDASKRGLMLANFYLAAKYCDELILRKDANGVDEWVPRFRLNIVIDQSKQAAEWIQIIAATMRASCYYSGSIFTVNIDRPKPITQIFNMTTLKEFTQSGASLRSVPNTYEVQYPNPDKSYTIDTFRAEDAVLLADASLEERKSALQLIGVTDKRQCQSLARYALDVGRTLTKMISFKTDRRAVYSQVGDVVGVQHDVPQWGFGGIIEAVDEITGALTLSDDFLPVTGVTYSLSLVRDNGQLSVTTAITFTGEIVTEVLPSTAFTTDPLLGEVEVLLPQAGDRYVIGSLPVNPFRVTMIKEDRDGLYELSCIQYNAAIYAAADAIYGAPTEAVPDYSLLVPMTRDPVSGVSARVKTYLDGTGTLRNGIEVFYAPPYNKSNWAGCTLYYGLAGSGAFSTKPLSSSGYFFIGEVSNGTYTFILPSTWKDGAQQSLNEALSDYNNRPFTTLKVEFLTDLIDAPEVDWEIRGLQIENKGNSEEFTGKDCIITWRRPRLLGQNETAGEEGGIDTSSWITGYLVEVLNANGTVRRSSTVTTPRFVYSLEMNHQDGIARSFLLRVTTIGGGGNFSTPATIAVNNPSPAPVANVIAEGLVAAYRLAFDPSPELDVVGYKVYVSTVLAEIDVVPGVEIEEAYLINKGPETSFSVPAAIGGAYYIRVAAYDTFGESGLNYSPVYAANVTAEIPHFLELFEDQLSENQLNTSLNERINLIDAEGTGLIAKAEGWDDSIDGLRTQYSVKIDNNGFMTGFGLASESVDGVPFSEFIISADRLAMINPAGTSYTISSISREATVMTVNTTFSPSLVVGDNVVVTGCAEHEYNGTWKVVSVPSSTSITVAISTTPTSPATLKDPLKPLKLWKAIVPFLIQNGKTYIDSALVGSIQSSLLYGGQPAWEFDTDGVLTMRNTDGSVLLQAGEKIKLAAIYEYSAAAPVPTSITAPSFS